jgi:hypothetical protein
MAKQMGTATETGMSDLEFLEVVCSDEMLLLEMAATYGGIPDKYDVRFKEYRFDICGYLRDFHNVMLWDKQEQIAKVCEQSVLKQDEKYRFKTGELSVNDLKYWKVGEKIKNWIAVDSGHGVGKTFDLAHILGWFYDCFSPVVGYCFCPDKRQLNDLLFKEIRKSRLGRDDLRGRVYEHSPLIYSRPNQFIKGIALDDRHGKGKTKIQGQHEKHQIFIIDEAEGVPKYVYDSIEAMTTGNICLVLVARNPETNTCEAAHIRNRSYTIPFTISCFEHPNVVTGQTQIPDSVDREFIELMCESHCNEATNHNVDERTFELFWKPGTIYKPESEFMWRVYGEVPEYVVGNTFCSYGRYDASKNRTPPINPDLSYANIGMDAARYGNDFGTIYRLYGEVLNKIKSIHKQDGWPYYIAIREECIKLHKLGVEIIDIRIDGGGGYGGTASDNLRKDLDLIELFKPKPIGTKFNGCSCMNCGCSSWLVTKTNDVMCRDCDEPRKYNPGIRVIEVHNGGVPKEPIKYADRITELYDMAAKQLEHVCLGAVPNELKEDLCKRPYSHYSKMVRGQKRVVKKILDKEKFKKEIKRSPDDGDGAVLTLAPSHLFRTEVAVGGVAGRKPLGRQTYDRRLY